MPAIDQRTFYLMLSPTEGQMFAESMGFAVPSEDVQEVEIVDVLTRWMTLFNSGAMDEIVEAGEWFVDLLISLDKLSSPPREFRAALTVFAMGLLNKMMDAGKLGLFLTDNDLENMEFESD